MIETGVVAVTANPSGTATGELTKLQIGDVIYEIAGGGGSQPIADSSMDISIDNGKETIWFNGFTGIFHNFMEMSFEEWLNAVEQASNYQCIFVAVNSTRILSTLYTEILSEEEYAFMQIQTPYGRIDLEKYIGEGEDGEDEIFNSMDLLSFNPPMCISDQLNQIVLGRWGNNVSVSGFSVLSDNEKYFDFFETEGLDFLLSVVNEENDIEDYHGAASYDILDLEREDPETYMRLLIKTPQGNIKLSFNNEDGILSDFEVDWSDYNQEISSTFINLSYTSNESPELSFSKTFATMDEWSHYFTYLSNSRKYINFYFYNGDNDADYSGFCSITGFDREWTLTTTYGTIYFELIEDEPGLFDHFEIDLSRFTIPGSGGSSSSLNYDALQNYYDLLKDYASWEDLENDNAALFIDKVYIRTCDDEEEIFGDWEELEIFDPIVVPKGVYRFSYRFDSQINRQLECNGYYLRQVYAIDENGNRIDDTKSELRPISVSEQINGLDIGSFVSGRVTLYCTIFPHYNF